ncbi:MAG: GTP cyclohydrolase II [Rhodospirillaceae bacterium]|jgi:GTP cyclohydrolase II|nr:GTP cyclohydrolase II [Rhodospirillaceae bacterium]MBT5663731.1 GTP cyclohydrolase II [Rhodospirillaceae bacterium]MBT5812493.1 GTP cyclohydrolase II [Rhodospirillaceae bacterium]
MTRQTQTKTQAQAQAQDQSRALNRSVTAVARAIGDLRRGAPVVLRAAQSAIIVAAAENGPGALTAVTDHDAACVITAPRAQALGLDQGDATAIVIESPDPLSVLDIETIIGDAAAQNPTLLGSTLSGSTANPLQMAAVELVKLARLLPAALVSDCPPATNATPEVTPEAYAAQENLLIVDADDIVRYRAASEELLDAVVEVDVPLAGAENTRMVAFRPADGGKTHLAIIVGAPDPAEPVLTRLHSECFTGDLLGSLRCDCGDQLRGAIDAIAAAGGGILLYLAQEGRGIGLVNKLRAYQLQDAGFDTIDANERLGFDADERVYTPAANMLKQLGYRSVRLMTNNPVKVAALSAHGVMVSDRVPHAFPANGHNEHYLQTKAARGGHIL